MHVIRGRKAFASRPPLRAGHSAAAPRCCATRCPSRARRLDRRSDRDVLQKRLEQWRDCCSRLADQLGEQVLRDREREAGEDDPRLRDRDDSLAIGLSGERTRRACELRPRDGKAGSPARRSSQRSAELEFIARGGRTRPPSCQTPSANRSATSTTFLNASDPSDRPACQAMVDAIDPEGNRLRPNRPLGLGLGLRLAA